MFSMCSHFVLLKQDLKMVVAILRKNFFRVGVGFKCASVIKLKNRECSWMKMAEEDLRHWHNNLNLKKDLKVKNLI